MAFSPMPSFPQPPLLLSCLIFDGAEHHVSVTRCPRVPGGDGGYLSLYELKVPKRYPSTAPTIMSPSHGASMASVRLIISLGAAFINLQQPPTIVLTTGSTILGGTHDSMPHNGLPKEIEATFLPPHIALSGCVTPDVSVEALLGCTHHIDLARIAGAMLGILKENCNFSPPETDGRENRKNSTVGTHGLLVECAANKIWKRSVRDAREATLNQVKAEGAVLTEATQDRGRVDFWLGNRLGIRVIN
ncbi:hypothetical protein DFH06DRAFT_1392380 [Mycena polygramma]|nr:hypothetical protein DFH06DRAFT_1392380 [Mycena polygramma]